jgi:hypothetical protein
MKQQFFPDLPFPSTLWSLYSPSHHHSLPLQTQVTFSKDDPVIPISIPEQKNFGGIDFPLVLGPNPDYQCRPDGRCGSQREQEMLNNWIKTATPDVVDELLLKVYIYVFYFILYICVF